MDDYENTSCDNELIDYFSDEKGKKLSVPDKLFFGEGGLIPLFKKYKFTVHENTPVEQEVALDPELLGKTFENLLAAHTPETQENARKQTGSYYTPREIVDYMTAESLTESLLAKIGGGQAKRKQIRALFDYVDSENDSSKQNFTKATSKKLVRAIANIKIFDPAVGSGAFPMSALHLLSLALSKLDPENNEWETLQKERAQKNTAKIFDKSVSKEREEHFQEINNTFEKYSDEFGRKLYLIQNSIFGADIQPIACQIAKLRFFISLAIEQKPNNKIADNYGIKPLPNLETRIVAADTLIALIQDKAKMVLGKESIDPKKDEIMQNRERYFNASNRKDKLDCVEKDQKLRQELKKQLIKQGFPHENAGKIADWNPYNPNVPAADWFDAEYMFDVADGFSIVIGNPPYVKLEHIKDKTKRKLNTAFGWKDDLYAHFIFKGMEYTQSDGVCSYITNDSFIALKSKKRVRELLLENKITALIKCPEETFDATIYAAIFAAVKAIPRQSHEYQSGIITHPEYTYHPYGPVAYKTIKGIPDKKLLFANPMLHLHHKMTRHGKFESCFAVSDTGIHSGNVREKIFFARNPKGDLDRLLQGRQINRFCVNWDAPDAKYKFCNIHYSARNTSGIGRGGKPSNKKEYWQFRGGKDHLQPERLLIRQTGDSIVAAYHSEEELGQFYTDNTLFTVLPKDKNINLKFALVLLNSKLINALYQSIIPEKGKIMAQIKIGNIRMLPIILPPKAKQLPFIKLAEKIIAAKQADSSANTTADEEKIDRLVYKLYGLTKKEIKIVESFTALKQNNQ